MNSSNNDSNSDIKSKSSIVRKFKTFFMRGNVIDLAIGVIIGDAFSRVIKSIVDDILMPPIGMMVGRISFSDLKWVLKPGTESSSEVAITYGDFLQIALNFLIISLCIFFLILLIGKDPEKIKTKDEAQAETAQKTNQLLEEIRDELKNQSGQKSSNNDKKQSQKVKNTENN